MSFLLKKFTDADQAKYDSLHLVNRLNTFRYPLDWLVDEERNAIFVVFGGRGYLPPERCEPPTFYALVWQGQTIAIEAFYTSTFLTESREVIWYRLKVFLSRELEDKLETIKEIVREALMEKGTFSRSSPEAVNVEFTEIHLK